MYEFKMPSLGAEMDSGKLIEWKVKPGDSVKRGESIAVVDTDKAAIEIEIWQDGIVEELLAQPGEKIPVGTTIATIRTVDKVSDQKSQLPQIKESVTSTPVKRMASDPNLVAGIRRATAAAMTLSKREIPHYYLSHSIDMNRAMQWLKSENEKRDVSSRLIYAVLLIKAVSRACVEVPEMNGFWKNDQFLHEENVNVGVAISLKSAGLLAPAIVDVNQKTLSNLMSELRDLVNRARSGTLRSSEVATATITITNLGELGVDQVFGVIYPPQVALVGFGKISAHNLMISTLSADHRASDGYRGGLFLNAINRYLQEPDLL